MQHTFSLREQLTNLFRDEDISVMNMDIDRAVEIVTICKAQGETAYNTAVAVINDLTLNPYYLAFEQALIEHGIFKGQ